jgi:Flp pilus assembly protein TadG
MRGLAASAGKKRLGVAAVEFAFVAPFLMVVILGIIEFGRVLMVAQILTNGAREGCRTAVLPGSTMSAARQTAVTYLNNSSIPVADPSNQITISPDPSSSAPGTAVTVTVSVPFNSVSWLPGPLFMGGKTLTSSVVMRMESNNN